ERREELVRGECLRTRKPVEERGLAGIRVADQSYRAHLCAAPRAPLCGALALDARQPLPQNLCPNAEEPAVGLELRFAGPTQSDAAFLPLEVGPAADQPCQLMLDLRELDLELALGAARPQREDVEDQARTVDDAALERALKVALLRSRQR